MRIAVIDADLIGRKRHRFPNLACMKLSGFHKEAGDAVTLKMDYGGLDEYTERTMSLSEARQHPGEVAAYIGEPGRVVLMTNHGKGRHAMMSVETYRNLRARADCAYAFGG